MALSYADIASLTNGIDLLTGNQTVDNPDMFALQNLSKQLMSRVQQGADPGSDAQVQLMYSKIQDLMGNSQSVNQQLKNNPVLNDQINQATTGGVPGDLPSSGGTGGPRPQPTNPASAIDEQAGVDRGKIESEGQRQYQQSLDQISSDTSARQTARQQLAEALTKQAQDSFSYGLPSTLEDLNARHLLNGSGVGQEIARQQGQIATGIADQIGTLGAGDITDASAERAAALKGMQGFQTSGLNREFSLQDFQRQADLSRQIGAMASPQVGGGKGAVGTGLGAVGSLAPVAALAFPGSAPALMATSAAATAGSRASSGGGGK